VAGKLWVAQLIVSDAVAGKLPAVHGLSADEVRDAVQCVAGLVYGWEADPARGRRALVEVEIRGRTILVVLYPVSHPMGDVYALGSAYERA
jgi:hypothetical protein